MTIVQISSTSMTSVDTQTTHTSTSLDHIRIIETMTSAFLPTPSTSFTAASNHVRPDSIQARFASFPASSALDHQRFRHVKVPGGLWLWSRNWQRFLRHSQTATSSALFRTHRRPRIGVIAQRPFARYHESDGDYHTHTPVLISDIRCYITK
ncbi:hypothetical protein BDN71DRAFT_980278 [Pleurotus eryngii]|uniref:Uncharacterized protein n=1 Tax=Pleurotus eryngii TaxID=5323 RepID=A0A9P6DEU1_PLEER|nr:hypothetical protein BDN71DRAFT_980278 [Pleurotus eryngii]